MKTIERNVRGECGQSSRRLRMAVKLAVLASSGSLAASAWAQEALPAGGQIVAGHGTIAESGDAMTVTQHTDRMVANWQSFSIGAGNVVNFVQPGASSVALNRVVGQDPSQILGSLNANGQVFLVNPNGVVIGRGAQVHTGGLVASSLDIADPDFLAGVHRFTGTGGAVRNEGDISGSVVALLAPSVVNDGTITGNTALAAGTNVLLDFAGDGLLSVEVSASTVETLVDNRGLIRADGGVAILTARGASHALQGVVNNSGSVQARTLANRNGRILLLADMEQGAANIGGTLDASAPSGGNGGFIETSGRNVNIADDAHITTHASAGESGTWLIDPNDFTIAASGGNLSGAALSHILTLGNVVISTSTQGTPEGNGDIFVNDGVSWSSNTLTLMAERNIVIDTAMHASGTAGLGLWYGQGAPANNNSARYIVNAPIDLPASGSFSTRLGNDGALLNYTIVTSLGNEGSSNDGTLQGIVGNLSGNYVLGADIVASADSRFWNGGQGFTPLGGNGDIDSAFDGIFDGLGHGIYSLTINRPGTRYVGLFGGTGADAIVRNVGMQGSVIGYGSVGGLVGFNRGTIADTYSGSVAGMHDYVGGLVGFNIGTVLRSYSNGTVTSTGSYVGGLVGTNARGFIEQSHAGGAVIGSSVVGGLVGYSTGYVTASHATGNVNGLGGGVGGLVGVNEERSISESYATGAVTGGAAGVGGLVGVNDSGNISRSHATGPVEGTTAVGGLVGDNDDGGVIDSFATGSVTGTTQVGGLVGRGEGPLSRVFASGRVSGGASTGALVGHLVEGPITAGFYDAETSGQGAACGSASLACEAVALTTQQMKDPFSFIVAGWNFFSVWGKSRIGENDGYMVLRASSTTEYDYYVRLSDASFQRTYGDANPDLSGIALDGVGASLVTLSWGDAVTPRTHAGLYSLADANVLNPQFAAGAAADYYFDYGRGALSIDRAALTGTLVSSSRTYDGQSFSGGNGIVWSGFVLGENESALAGTLSYGGTAQGARNAGTYSITASGLSSGNYDITYLDGGLTIDPRVISLAGSRAYDGTTNVEASAFTLDNLVNGESLTLSGVGMLGDRNAGSAKAVSLGNLSLRDGQALASNYTLAGGMHSVDVARRAINVTNVTADNKVYDGTTAATLQLGGAGLAGTVAGDDVAVAGATGEFGDKNVGTGKIVSITGLALGGGDAGNYMLAGTTATAVANITPREISAISGITADDKVYDGTAAATLNLNGAGLVGMVAGDDVAVTTAVGAFEDKNVATGKAVSVTGIALGGADVGNYMLTNTAAMTLADITPRSIAGISGITANDKNYEGTTAATLNTGGASFAGAIAGDDLSVATAHGHFASIAPSVDATVYVAGLSLGGVDASNYTLADNSATTTASIHPVIVPPLQPGQGTNEDTDSIDENLFPLPSSDILTSGPPVIEHWATIEPVPDADFARPRGLQFESDCNMDTDGTGKSRCNVPPTQQ